jgi:hypothetical protein
MLGSSLKLETSNLKLRAQPGWAWILRLAMRDPHYAFPPRAASTRYVKEQQTR